MTTLDRLQAKASSLVTKVKMPSILQIEKLLTEKEIKFDSSKSINKYGSDGKTSKKGRKLSIPISEEESKLIAWGKINIDSSEIYYSDNTNYYAGQIVMLLKLRGKI